MLIGFTPKLEMCYTSPIFFIQKVLQKVAILVKLIEGQAMHVAGRVCNAYCQSTL